MCMDSSGDYLGSSSSVIHGVWDVATLVAIACREAHALAEDLLLLHDFVVAIDSKQISNDIQKGRRCMYGQVIDKIRF